MIKKRKNKTLRVIVDTSVVIAGIAAIKKPLIVPCNESQQVLRFCLSDKFIWCFSEAILEEYKGIMKKVKIRPVIAGSLINNLRDAGLLIEVKEVVSVSTDPFDDMFYSCANSGDADIIVTLNIKDFPQIGKKPKIMTPEGFVKQFAS